jgi:hypothetical protein
VVPVTWEVEAGGLWPKAALDKSTRPYPKQRKAKRAQEVAQVV